MNFKQCKVIFEPSGRQAMVPKGVSILEAARRIGVGIEALCGGKGSCGKCVVRVKEGTSDNYGITSGPLHVSPWQEGEGEFIDRESRQRGDRLGCVAKVQKDVRVHIPEASRAAKQVVGKAPRDFHIDYHPAVRVYFIEVRQPAMGNASGDLDRVLDAMAVDHGLQDLSIDIQALRQLPHALRKGEWKVTVSVWNSEEIIRIRPGKCNDSYGMAVDIGTTTVAGYLCNLKTMEVIDTVSMMNPQCKFGEDVMSRITYHMTHSDGLEKMSRDIVEGINTLIEKAVAGTYPPKKKVEKVKENDTAEVWEISVNGERRPCLSTSDIEDLTIGCNTAMHHILLQIDPQYLGMAPFPPVIRNGLDIKARDMGIRINPGANVYILPNEAGFVGADNVGVLITEAPYQSDRIQLIIDIGTNGELVLGNRERLIASSCATGPALEGAHIKFGMRAAPGAIERLEIDPKTKEVNYKVIGQNEWLKFSKPREMKTKGICGSGILDLLAELLTAGVILKSGRFNQTLMKGHPRFRKNPADNMFEFVLAWSEETRIGKDIVVTQKDIREIQLAKGALYAGCKLMMRRMGIERPDQIKIAGAFGTHVDKKKALMMGLFPDCPLEQVTSIGNAAGDGCRAALLNVAKRREAEWVSRNVEYIELTVEEDFQKEFVAAMHLPHATDRFSSLKG